MKNDPTRRACLLGLAMLVPIPATAATRSPLRVAAPPRAPKQAPRGRAPAGSGKTRATPATARAPAPTLAAARQPQPQPRGRVPSGDERRPAAANRAAPPPPAQRPWPQIDGPPPPSRTPGLEPAPVPNGNILPPVGERGRVGPSVSFGVPTPPQLIEGQSFRAGDSAPQDRQQQQQGGGLRPPSPGATVRLPF